MSNPTAATGKDTEAKPGAKPKGPSLLALLKPYRGLVIALVVLAVLANALTLVLPLITATAIDDYVRGTVTLTPILIQFSLATLLVFIFTYLQNIVQTYAAERVARDLRTQLSAVISMQSNAYVQKVSSASLLTNLTSDADGVKMFISQAIASIISSAFLIAGSAVLLLLIDWKLALAVLTIIPIIGGTFKFVLSRVRKLFKACRSSACSPR